MADRQEQRDYIDRKMKWVDISTETVRVYEYESGYQIKIDNPVKLNVSKNGHRVADAQRRGHYIPYGWKHLYWDVKEDADVFVY